MKSNNVEFLWHCGGHFENGNQLKFLDVSNQLDIVEIVQCRESIRDIIIYPHEMSLKSDNVEFVQYCGGHFENGDR